MVKLVKLVNLAINDCIKLVSYLSIYMHYSSQRNVAIIEQ